MKPTVPPLHTKAYRLPYRLLAVAITIGFLGTNTASAETGHDHRSAAQSGESHHEGNHNMAQGEAGHAAMEDHSTHMQMMQSREGYQRSMTHYTLPDAELIDADGKKVRLNRLLADERPVILNFIYTSCTTVCPILSATLSKANQSLGNDDPKPLMISISIDPEYDTPERLREYASRYDADENWRFLTGKLETVVELQRAFSAYYGNKLNHKPLSFLRRGPEQQWVRLQGFTSSSELVAEYRALFDRRS
ncbi:MAG: SCO family protein [Pseudomonadota bacterium]